MNKMLLPHVLSRMAIVVSVDVCENVDGCAVLCLETHQIKQLQKSSTSWNETSQENYKGWWKTFEDKTKQRAIVLREKGELSKHQIAENTESAVLD